MNSPREVVMVGGPAVFGVRKRKEKEKEIQDVWTLIIWCSVSFTF